MNFFLKVLVTSLAVVVATYVLPGVDLQNFLSALLVALVLGLLNMLLKPLLVLLTIPVTIFTFGLFLLVINAFIVQIADFLIRGFEVQNFWWALLFSILLSLVTYLLELPVKKSRQQRY
ncbi:MAG TPA: phage holin family protein [Bacteroidales bacterium]|nr:phage holin family protein [Bacteroidales bacterium]HSV76692.1 phage holin family protein [Bacteroidales bacterium]